MNWTPAAIFRWLFDSRCGASNRLIARWLFLRALGVIYFSAFLSLFFQIKGLIGPTGILPAGDYLQAITNSVGQARYWYAPTLLWISTSSHALMLLCWAGLIASLLVTFNIFPRATLLVCFLCFLSFVTAASEFSGYQSDGMLLEAGLLSLFLAPPGFRPRLAANHPPMRAAVFLLLWEWFRIYFESGVAKLASGEPEWRNFTAMDDYYQNGPLPTWIGWYAAQLAHWFHAATAFGTLALELVIVWMLFLGRRARIICFFIVTPWQIGIILTANYTFLNYLVLVLAFFLLDDRFYARFLPAKWKPQLSPPSTAQPEITAAPFDAQSILQTPVTPLPPLGAPPNVSSITETRSELNSTPTVIASRCASARKLRLRDRLATLAPDWLSDLAGLFMPVKLALTAFLFVWLFYASTTLMIWMLWREAPLPMSPVAALEPFRVADRYGLFARMTRGRYEIEFQGSNDGKTWIAYPFRFKPQDPMQPPGIYAPYQPRFDWNLWFASLGSWQQNPIVPRTEMRLLTATKDVLALFAGNPFPEHPPRQIRAVLWQYWFSTREEKRARGIWWRRELLGVYAPTLRREPDGRVIAIDWPPELPPHD